MTKRQAKIQASRIHDADAAEVEARMVNLLGDLPKPQSRWVQTRDGWKLADRKSVTA